jgi:hypothetical protein
MAVRRTWMQYDAVRSGKVVVRFFVGLVRKRIPYVTVYFFHVIAVAIYL